MDPVSLTASIIAMIQIAGSTISICKEYITTVKDAPRDLRSIMIEVGNVKSILEVLESLIQSHEKRRFKHPPEAWRIKWASWGLQGGISGS